MSDASTNGRGGGEAAVRTPIEIVCDNIHESNKKNDNLETLRHFDELMALAGEGIPHESDEQYTEISNKVLKAWGRAVTAAVAQTEDYEHGEEMISAYEDLLGNGEPANYLKALIVVGDRPAEVIQNFQSRYGSLDALAVEGALDKFKAATRTDATEVLSLLDVLHVPRSQKVLEQIEYFYVQRMRKEDAEAVLQELKDDGVNPSTARPYNMVLFKQNLTRRTAMEYYDEMLDAGIRPEQSTNLILLKRPELTQDEKQQVRRSNRGQASYPLTTTIRKLIQEGNLDEADRQLQRTRVLGVVLDRGVFKIMIDACVNDPRRAEQYYNEMMAANIKPSHGIYSRLISIWKENRMGDTERWVKEMMNNGFEPDENVTGTLLDSYVRSNHRGPALQLLHGMLTRGTTNVHMYNTLMKLGPYDFAVGILGCMLSEGLRITGSTRTTLTNLSREPVTEEFNAVLDECNWDAERLLSNPIIVTALPGGHPSLTECMRLVLREIKLPQEAIENRTKMLQERTMI